MNNVSNECRRYSVYFVFCVLYPDMSMGWESQLINLIIQISIGVEWMNQHLVKKISPKKVRVLIIYELFKNVFLLNIYFSNQVEGKKVDVSILWIGVTRNTFYLFPANE